MTAKTSARTAGPWHSVVLAATGEHRIIAGHDKTLGAPVVVDWDAIKNPHDAAFIVTACNAYDANRALIASLTATLREIESLSMDQTDGSAGDAARIMQRIARIALSRTEKSEIHGA